MSNAPFNSGIHAVLVEMGYEYKHYECTFEDVGDPENGPQLDGDPAFDEYKSADEYIIISECGRVVHREDRDLEFEKWIDEQEERYLT